MQEKKFSKYKKALLYSIIGSLSIFIVTNPFKKPDDYSILRTSLLVILENLIDESLPPSPDLAIDSVYLKKISEPSYDLNYYKYDATVVIENNGGHLLNSALTISAEPDQQHKFVKNTDIGFELGSGKKYIVRDYEVLFDGKYNGGEINFGLNLNADLQEDLDESNNHYTAAVFEGPSKLENIEIKEILDDGTVAMSFEPAYFYLTEDDFEVYVSDSLDIPYEDLKYTEVYTQDDVYEYYRAKNSLNFIESDGWEPTSTDSVNAHFVSFDEDPLTKEDTHYVYVRATNPENGNYVFSNILVFPPQQKLNRAEFARAFVENADIPLENGGYNFYKDVDEDAWYAPYVQTLYNLGLFGGLDSTAYKPDEMINRGEALRVMMDYFDMDLVAGEEPHFEDMPEDNYLYPYLEGLFEEGKAGTFNKQFNPESSAGIHYLNHLIDGFKENS